MTAEQLALFAGALLSLGFSYIPGLNEWYAALTDVQKKLIMAGLLLLVALGVFGIACAGLGAGWGVSVPCTVEGAQGLVTAFVLALIANQATYLITPQPKAVKEAKGEV